MMNQKKRRKVRKDKGFKRAIKGILSRKKKEAIQIREKQAKEQKKKEGKK